MTYKKGKTYGEIKDFGFLYDADDQQPQKVNSNRYMPEVFPDFGSVEDALNWTGKSRWNAVYTVTIGELVDRGVFDWSLECLDWSKAAYSPKQYLRVCEYFIERFKFREISIEPFFEWATMLRRKLVFELMPKYKNLYQYLDENFDPAQNRDNYTKRRTIGSAYPETLLSGNSDYASDGTDEEREDIERGNLLESYTAYVEQYRSIDASLLDECESMFIGLYTASINGM